MKKIIVGGILGVFAFSFASTLAFAARVEMQNDVAVRGDFDLGPTSFAIEGVPGEKITKTLQVTNRKGIDQEFKVGVEDFEGSATNPEQTTLLQGDGEGKYGAKNWIKSELSNFTLVHGERQFFDVTVEIPTEATPGDHYASVLVSAAPKIDVKDATDQSKPNVRITSRVGALFFVRVKGEYIEKGSLESFETAGNFFKKLPVPFSFVFKNEGTVRLQPYGNIVISDALGREVKKIEIKSFNSLRDSVRKMDYAWESEDKFLLGKYTAKITLNRGYEDKVDIKSVSFWIIPVKELAIFGGAALLVLAVGIFIKRKVKFSLEIKK